MKARFEVWRVLGDHKAYSGVGYGFNGVAVCITRKFARNHFGRRVWMALLPFSTNSLNDSHYVESDWY